MDGTYEIIKTEKEIPAMIQYLNRAHLTADELLEKPVFIPPHWHRSIEMTLVMKGQGEVWIGNEKQEVYPGEFIFVNSGCVHQIQEISGIDSEALVLIISYDFIKKIYPNIDDVYFEIPKEAIGLERIKLIYQDLKEHCLRPQPLDEIKINGYLYEIVYFLLHQCVSLDHPKEKRIQVMNQIQKDILSYVDKHYHEPLSLDEIATHFDLSEEHFSRKFHQYFGISFKQYLVKYRLYQALNDILYSEEEIQLIAMKHGFPNVKSFIEYFKKAYNKTPYQFRKYYQSSRNNYS